MSNCVERCAREGGEGGVGGEEHRNFKLIPTCSFPQTIDCVHKITDATTQSTFGHRGG